MWGIKLSSFLSVVCFDLIAISTVVAIDRYSPQPRHFKAIGPFAVSVLQCEPLNAVDERKMPIHIRIDGNGAGLNCVEQAFI